MADQTNDSPPRGMKRLVLIGLAVIMAVAAGTVVIFVPRHERIDIGRPLGTMYIRVSDGIVFERRGTGTYALIHEEYSGTGTERKLQRRIQAVLTYLPQPPKGWEDARWPVRASMVADPLLNAKRPGRAGRICWAGRLHRPRKEWMALPYQQTFYSSGGLADENYRGIFLIFRSPSGGVVLLDLFKRREDVKTTSDWKRARDYFAQINRMVHFKDKEHPRLVDSNENLAKVAIPKSNPLCLGSYLMVPPKGTEPHIEAGGYYRLKDERRGVEAFVSYRGDLPSGVLDDPLQALQAERCRPRLEFMKGQPEPATNGDVTMRYTRTTHVRDRSCTPRFYGLLASRRLPDGSTITFDVFVRSRAGRQPLHAHWWRQIDDYLHSLEEQTLSKCHQPGTGNDPGASLPVSVRSVVNRPASSPLRIDANSTDRCVS